METIVSNITRVQNGCLRIRTAGQGDPCAVLSTKERNTEQLRQQEPTIKVSPMICIITMGSSN